MEQLDVIEPRSTAVAYRGETLQLRPLAVGAVPKIIRLARPVIDELLSLESLPKEGSDELVDLAFDMIDKHGSAVFQAVALAVGKDAAWIEEGDMSEFIDLCQTLFEVNRDFFVRRLGPLLAERARARVSTSGAGPMPSSSSSSVATA